MAESTKNYLHIPKVIAIAGGKGGIGKTFIAINLSSALHRMGKKVILLDGDFGLANIHLLLGEKPNKNVTSVLEGQCNIEDILLPTHEGFALVPGSRGQPPLAQLKSKQLLSIISSVDQLNTLPDVLLIDTAGGIGETELLLVAAANEIVIVVTTDMMALHDAAEYIRQMSFIHGVHRFSIIINMSKNQREAYNALEQLHVLVGFDVDVVLHPIGSIILEDAVRQATSRMSSIIEFAPHSKATQQFFEIAEKIINNRHLHLNNGLSFFYEHRIRARGA